MTNVGAGSMPPTRVFQLSDIGLVAPQALASEASRLSQEGFRPLSLFASASGPNAAHITLLMGKDNGTLSIQRTLPMPLGGSYPALSADQPAFQAFEREIFEQWDLRPVGHPWLKPLRYPRNGKSKMVDYPFFRLDGKEVHEVGVGPVHAGIIEPGHFRFMCFGEKVHHLEVQLGYQHRGAEALLLKKNPRQLSALVESVVGDTSVAHVLAHSLGIEALSEAHVPLEIELYRTLALELERIAMHLVGLSGVAGDIGYMPGTSTYGRLRTTIINTSMLLCGSRFGRGWIRPGGIGAGLSREQAAEVRKAVSLVRRDIDIINKCMFSARSVLHRLEGTGTLSKEDANALGIVGLAARACGIPVDTRRSFPGLAYTKHPIALHTARGGDCLARIAIRRDETSTSLDWIDGALSEVEGVRPSRLPIRMLRPNALVVSIVEGWRGEVIHCLETGEAGALVNYRLQDPSIRNWFGLATAVRNNAIYDFPVCNKSFDLSYCGHDL